MARADQLKRLFQCYAARDDAGFRQTADEIIAEEGRANHHLLAEDLRTILARQDRGAATCVAPLPLAPLPRDARETAPLIAMREPRVSLEDAVLDGLTQSLVDRVLQEARARQRLLQLNLRPRQKLLFCGLPGCGKTLTAEAMAQELGLPFVLTRVEAVVSSYLGETSANLRRVFDFAESTPCVLLLDEFDSIGKSRDDAHEVGELKRVVNSFLQMLDGYSGRGLVIAATNHQSLLDPALWRRFDEVIYFPKPKPNETARLLRLLLRGIDKSSIEPSRMARAFHGFAHSEICDVVSSAIKHMVLAGTASLSEADLLAELKRYRQRRKVYHAYLSELRDEPANGKINGNGGV